MDSDATFMAEKKPYTSASFAEGEKSAEKVVVVPPQIVRIPIVPPSLNRSTNSTSRVVLVAANDNNVPDEPLSVDGSDTHMKLLGRVMTYAASIIGQVKSSREIAEDESHQKRRRVVIRRRDPTRLDVIANRFAVLCPVKSNHTALFQAVDAAAMLKLEARASDFVDPSIRAVAIKNIETLSLSSKSSPLVAVGLADDEDLDIHDPLYDRKLKRKLKRNREPNDAREGSNEDESDDEGSKAPIPPQTAAKPLAVVKAPKSQAVQAKSLPSPLPQQTSTLQQSMPPPLPLPPCPADLERRTVAMMERLRGRTVAEEELFKPILQSLDLFPTMKVKSAEERQLFAKVCRDAMMKRAKEFGCTMSDRKVTIPS